MCHQIRQLHSVCGHVTEREIPCEVATSTPKKTPPEPWPPAVDTGSKMKDAFLTWCLKSLKPVATKTRPRFSTCRPPLTLLQEVEYGFCLKCREHYETYAAETLGKDFEDATRSADEYKKRLRWCIPVQAGRVPAEYVFRTQDSKSGRSAGAGLERQELVMLQQVTKIIGMDMGDGGSASRLEKVKNMRRKTLEWAEEGDSARRRSERERKAEMKRIEVEKERAKERLQQERLQQERLQQERLEQEKVEKERLREDKIERKKRLEEERFEEERRSRKENRLEIKKWLRKKKKARD
ncbi:hypothetical protein N0V85_007434 [Neurospora sp. IMI 360204]|nr:hypothetical protein N0V85_007434 [Neurospora sp. IMI 360204]